MPALIDLDDKAGFSRKASEYRNAKNFYMVTDLEPRRQRSSIVATFECAHDKEGC